jgi:hypothetical protein
LNRGLSVVDTYRILVGKELSEAVYLKVSILGWAVELVLHPIAIADVSCKRTFLLPMILWIIPLLDEANRVGIVVYSPLTSRGAFETMLIRCLG